MAREIVNGRPNCGTPAVRLIGIKGDVNGSNMAIDIPTLTLNPRTTNFTALIWFKLHISVTPTGWYNMQLLNQMDSDGGVARTFIVIPYAEPAPATGTLATSLGVDTNDNFTSLYNPNADKWMCVSIERDISTEICKMRIGGILAKTKTSHQVNSVSGFWRLGASKNPPTGNTPTRGLNGWNGPTMVFGRPLTDNEHLYFAQKQFNRISRDNLELELLMDTDSSGNLIDTSGNNHQIILRNGAALESGAFMPVRNIVTNRTITTSRVIVSG